MEGRRREGGGGKEGRKEGGENVMRDKMRIRKQEFVNEGMREKKGDRKE